MRSSTQTRQELLGETQGSISLSVTAPAAIQHAAQKTAPGGFSGTSQTPTSFKEKRIKPVAKKKADMLRIRVRFEGPPGPGRSRYHFDMCSNPEQTVKWLSLACSQRLQLQAPHGLRRARELEKFRQGCITPAEVCTATGQPINPMRKLKEVFEDGDEAVLKLTAKFDSRYSPSVGVTHRGEPRISRFSKVAFQRHAPEAWTPSSSRHNPIEPHPPAGTRSSSSIEQFNVSMNVNAANFRLLMADQMTFSNNFSLMTQEDTKLLADLALMQEFDNMGVFHALNTTKEDEKKIREIIGDNITRINDIFRYYCGYSHGSSDSPVGGNTASMSLLEFDHLISYCKVFDRGVNDHMILASVFKHANKEFDSEEHSELARDNPDSQLLRYEFFECLIRLAALKWPDLKHPAAVQKIVVEHVLPHSDNMNSDDFRAGLQRKDVQDLFGRCIKDILVVYRHYANLPFTTYNRSPTQSQNTERTVMEIKEAKQTKNQLKSWQTKSNIKQNKAGQKPTMSLDEFTQLMIDSALLNNDRPPASQGPTSQSGVRPNELTPREGRLCFAQSQQDQDTTYEDLAELVFPEFCEALARVAIAKWDGQGMSFKDKIALAIKSMVRVEKSILRHQREGRLKGEQAKKPRRPRRRKQRNHDANPLVDEIRLPVKAWGV